MLFTTWVSRIFKLLIPNFCDFFWTKLLNGLLTRPTTHHIFSRIPNPRVSKFQECFNQSESEEALFEWTRLFFYCLKYRENWKLGIRNWWKHVVNSSKVINSSFYRVYMCSMNPTLSLGSPSSSYTNLFDRIHANKNQFLLDNEV